MQPSTNRLIADQTKPTLQQLGFNTCFPADWRSHPWNLHSITPCPKSISKVERASRKWKHGDTSSRTMFVTWPVSSTQSELAMLVPFWSLYRPWTDCRTWDPSKQKTLDPIPYYQLAKGLVPRQCPYHNQITGNSQRTHTKTSTLSQPNI